MQEENIISRSIETELQTSYLTYAMSVNTNRAIPDVRDGLKPSARRIIYAMGEINLTSSRPYDKCAAVVGEVMKNFHPHGDGPIYGTLVGLAQEFSTRYPLIDGQGNFGSIDDDPAGAMRYTECRLSKIAETLLLDIDKDTVDFQPNYKESLEEPTVLPGLLPNLLVNGTDGIGIGYSTKIPPHNLNEVVDTLLHVLDFPDATVEELMEFLPGPDFPTAGIIVGKKGIKDMYSTGKGSMTMRAKVEIEPITHDKSRGDREQIVVTEIPYQIKKNLLLQQMVDQVNISKTITGISDIRDESDEEIRIVIELKRGEVPQVVLNQLYKHTKMQHFFPANLLCLVEGLPKILTLPEILRYYLAHRREVIRRRTQFDLARCERRAHILEGYRIALEHLEEVIELVQTAETPQEAREQLITQYELSEDQANEVLGLTLSQLTGLGRQNINDEYSDLLERIAELKAILESEDLVTNIIREELEGLKEDHGDDRLTEIVSEVRSFEMEDLIADEEMVVTLTHSGYLKRIPMDTYRTQNRGGVGIKGGNPKDGDFLEQLLIATAHQSLLFFTSLGKCYVLKVFEIPEGSRQAAGRAAVNMLKLSDSETITAFLPIREFNEDLYILMATKSGIVKKSPLGDFRNPISSGIIAVNLDPDDQLIEAHLTDGNYDVILVSHNGNAIRFNESDVRSMGRRTRGVRGIRLAEEDFVVDMVCSADENDSLLIVTENGYGKRTGLSAYRSQKRGGVGLTAIKRSTRNGAVVSAKLVTRSDELVLISSTGYITRMAVSDIRSIGRTTQGVRLMTLQEDETLVDVGKISEADSDSGVEG
ncbi:MAG: DNA gyrase subunit A [Candidatus Poribacteria bacterium]|nr:DNA gyrase subunit A [Candidatus Poribacteria bacterium]MDE0315572.1 DNA gyrase subunit A [Candidatus Poribacteria bacterium]